MYLKKFEIRWSDLDANRHVANSSYLNFLSETRMSFLNEQGFTQQSFEKHNIGPVIFSEELFYLSEIKLSQTITVSLELLANSQNYKYIKFAHAIFNAQNKLSVYSETFFGWINLLERKLIAPPIEIITAVSALPKAEKYTILDNDLSLKNPKIPFSKKIK